MEDTIRNLSNSTSLCEPVDNVVYWALNCYAVTIYALVFTLCTMAVGAIVIFLNAIAFSAILRHRDIEQVTHILIGSLALSDLLLGVFIVYHSIYNLGNWQIYEECVIRYGILIGANTTTVFHLVLLTIDRYVKIAHPFLYQRIFGEKLVLSISAVLWIVAFIVGFSPLIAFETETNPLTAKFQCGFLYVINHSLQLIFIILYAAPMILNAVIYARIFCITRRHAKMIAAQQNTKQRHWAPSASTITFTKTAGFLMGFYFFCWTPTGIFISMNYNGSLLHMTEEDKGVVLIYLGLLAFINSLGNPIIYAFKIPYIKKRFITICGGLPCCRSLKTPQSTQLTTSSTARSHTQHLTQSDKTSKAAP